MHTRLIATTDPHRVKPVTVNMKKTLRQLLMWNTYNVTYSKVIKPCYCKSYIANINEKQSPQIVVNKSKCWCPENLVLRLMCVEQRTGPCTVFYCEHVWFSGYLALYYGVFIHVFTNIYIIFLECRNDIQLLHYCKKYVVPAFRANEGAYRTIAM